jgi:hypothetical protein
VVDVEARGGVCWCSETGKILADREIFTDLRSKSAGLVSPIDQSIEVRSSAVVVRSRQEVFFDFFASGTSRTTSSFQRATLRVERRREEAVVDVEARGGVPVF